MKSMKLYIGGGIHNVSNYEQVFDETEEILKGMGHIPVNPVRHDREIAEAEGLDLNALENDEDFANRMMKWDIEQLLHCDGIVLIAGWEKSRGARHECEQARLTGLPVFHLVKPNSVWVLVPPSSFGLQNAQFNAASSTYLQADRWGTKTTGGVTL